jgi:hypothetical protein
MRVAGTASWRLEESSGSLSEQALFVRDAARLAPPGNDMAPPLIGDVPDRSDVLGSADRQRAGVQWLNWWNQVLDLELRRSGDSADGDASASARARLAEHDAVCDPPNFTALANRPQLQAAAGATFEDFTRWQSTIRPRSREPRQRGLLEWSLIKQTAEDVAFDRRVDIDAARATVVIVSVHGLWWRRVAPGAVLCSVGAATDPLTAQTLLRDAFDSRITG